MLPEIGLTLNSEDMKWTVEGGSEECFAKTLFLENMVKWGILEYILQNAIQKRWF